MRHLTNIAAQVMSHLTNIPAKSWALAKSKKLAIALIASLTLVVTIDIALPLLQGKISFAAALQSVFSYRKWWFQLLCLLLLLNLTTCTIDGAVRRARAKTRAVGLWGSTLFHTGLIIILAGALVTSNFMMSGALRVSLGETQKEAHDAYSSISEGPFFREENHRGFGITLLKQDKYLDSQGNIDKDKEYSLIEISENGKKIFERGLFFGDYLSYRGVYLFNYTSGYSAILSLQAPGAKEAIEVTVPLRTEHWPNGIRTYYEPEYRTDSFPYPLSLNFYPDLNKDPNLKTGYVNKSFKVVNPALYVVARDGNKIVAEKMIRPNETFEIKGYRLAFKDVLPWTTFRVVRDPGGRVVLVGVVIAIIGLCVTFLWGSGISLSPKKAKPGIPG